MQQSSITFGGNHPQETTQPQVRNDTSEEDMQDEENNDEQASDTNEGDMEDDVIWL